MEKTVFYTHAENCELYCEKRGRGPLVVMMPDGINDCEIYAGIAELIADIYTVVTFDPRGGSRSMPSRHCKITPEILADDIAAIIRQMNMGKATVFGCSSGGQGALMTGVKYPELVKNIIVHEAALQLDVQLPSTGFDYIVKFGETYGPHLSGRNINPFFAALFVDTFPEKDFDAETNERIEKNIEYWNNYYLGTVDTHSYSEEELSRIPACDFSVGSWSPAWHPYANIQTAKRGGFSFEWMPSAHYPILSCPEYYADFLKRTIEKYN